MTDLVQRLRQFRRTPIFASVHEAADRIERQDEAIRQLREALKSVKRMSYDGSAQERTCDAALAATENLT